MCGFTGKSEYCGRKRKSGYRDKERHRKSVMGRKELWERLI